MADVSNYAIYLGCLFAFLCLFIFSARWAVIRNRRRQGTISTHGGFPRTLPFPATTPGNRQSWDRGMTSRSAAPVTRVESRHEEGLPSYNAPGIKVPESAYNPAAATGSLSTAGPSSLPSTTDYSTPDYVEPYVTPAGRPPSYRTPSFGK